LDRDGGDGQLTDELLAAVIAGVGSPAIEHRVEDGFFCSKQRDVIQMQNPRNEAGKLISHVGGHLQSGQLAASGSLRTLAAQATR
jgi:hypothetical protein